jgi:GTP-sensing pleiotropic transcriptional regulator CodY
MYNDKMIENINSKLQNLSSLVKNQLIFNKMIEAQIAQIVAAILVDHSGKILGQPKNSPKFVPAAVEQ